MTKSTIYRISILAIAFFLTCNLNLRAQQPSVINWKHFLSGSDMVYDTLTTAWHEGAFTGNGLLGTMIYLNDANSIRMDIGRTDVRDHRIDSMPALFAKARLPIGHFIIKPLGKIKKITARLDLWNAELRGSILTDKGAISFTELTFSQTNIIYFDAACTGQEAGFTWEWVADEPVSPRAKTHGRPANYTANPEAIKSVRADINLYNQQLYAGGGFTTAWKKIPGRSGCKYLITVANSLKDKQSVGQAFTLLSRFNAVQIKAAIQDHRDWWHNYYKKSFIAIPDKRIESFYWIQQYKLASATRANKPALDLIGPWLKPTPWPAYWYNLNIQLTYSPLYTSNRLDIASSLINMIDANKDNLVKNVPQEYRYNSAAIGRAGGDDMLASIDLKRGSFENVSDGYAELGNLTWILYYYWEQYRYSMDQKLADNLFPLLKRSINYYLHLLEKDATGQWHLSVKTYSPEYPGGTGYDTNYSLALLRWGCKILLQLNSELKQNDPLATQWNDVLQNLTPYPQDANGYMIAKDIPFNQSHRHYSHLLMIYPLYEINWDNIADREVISKSLARWHSFPQSLQGYSYTGGGSIYAMMGEGDKTLNCLNQLIDKYVKPNTMYLESGPVIETPLAACATIQEMYLQYWNNTARVFPALPAIWKDASFENLRTEGAFLLSAVRKNGLTKWVKIESLHGGSLDIKPGMVGEIKVQSKQQVQITNKGNGTYSLNMPQGCVAYLYSRSEDLSYKIAYTNGDNIKRNFFGKHR
ncbi:hypothetical protein BDD43_0230 [Mucilaginibacter gracilis]|uniref:Glycosyl hydrolase family 95 catalytic domain-containing protein n=1 Tax=Mucilaginibacter gracilis TaxID=423350 RepID=A0A495ITM8_9SPHI|nr:hypothetical protein [Mucilaginibacter gracilis]RKR80135.1 hypothetical protein BDD43_0230 [Mucilaginibacter gracilis]